jgi:transcriptional regulator of acetoin/glycerol metabolism
MVLTRPTEPGSVDLPQPFECGPALFVVLHAHAPARGASRHSLLGMTAVTIGRGDPPSVRRVPTPNGCELELRLADPRASARHARLIRAGEDWQLEDCGSRNGSFVNGEPTRRALLAEGDLIEMGSTFLSFGACGTLAALDVHAIEGTILPELAHTFAGLAVVARAGECVLVRGESGSGKELVARRVHELSGRRGPFVAVNCGALPESMVEAELFGHRRGAFSGATSDRAGLVRSSSGGTLFLDEIGDLRLGSQAALLRVLQEHVVTPVGSDAPEPVDLRVVCATHRDLEALVARGGFRADLLARLRGFVVELPALRHRRVDLGLLVAALLRKHVPAPAPRPALSSSAARALLTYDWPSNVRELEKCLTTALALAEGGTIRSAHLPEALRAPTLPPAPLRAHDVVAVGEPRRDRLTRLMREHEGNIAAVARALGKARTQVHRWLDRYQLDPDDFRP